MNMPSVYGAAAAAPMRHRALLLAGVDHSIELRHLVDLQLLQVTLYLETPGRKDGRRLLCNAQLPLVDLKLQPAGLRNWYLVVGPMVVAVTGHQAHAIRAWMCVELAA